ncbi:right-handed parallel beta-helix repeat-containing protein [candidate division WOR-3 bacterium]|nr:right-handed parallel beta-helix repeat-containing protein [candidate division WOR-3 bacterium]
MTRVTVVTVLMLACLALVFTGCPKKQTVALPDYDILVAADGSGDFESIGAALMAADEGDVIFVRAGTYYEDVEVETDRVKLIGAGPDRTVIDADGEYAAVTIDADNCRVEGFCLRGADSHGAYVRDGHHAIQHCLIIENGDRGVYFSSFSGEPSAVIDHCTIVENEVSGIYIPAQTSKTRVTNCIIAGNGRGIVADDDEGLMTVDWNCAWEDGDEFDRVEESLGENNIIEDPNLDRSFQPGPGSPCIGAASDGTNIGCF